MKIDILSCNFKKEGAITIVFSSIVGNYLDIKIHNTYGLQFLDKCLTTFFSKGLPQIVSRVAMDSESM